MTPYDTPMSDPRPLDPPEYWDRPEPPEDDFPLDEADL